MKLHNVLNIDVSQPVVIGEGDEQEIMTLYEAARWSCLIEGIDVINKKARQLKIDLDSSKSWIKPLALQKYIDEDTPSMIANIKNLKDREEE